MPKHLFVSASAAPQIPDREPPILQLPDAEFIRSLWSYNGTPAALLQNTELMEILMPIIRADFALSERWLQL